MKFEHILFPIDFSERSSALKKRVELIAAHFGSHVTLLHVFEIPAAWYGACEATFLNTECFNTLRDQTAQRLYDYEINVPEARVTRIIAEGDPAGQIMAWVDEHDVDLIVMGTHGYGPLQGWILGSVTGKILHTAACPVWTDSPLHPPKNDPAISKILCAVEAMEEAVPLLRFTKQLAEELHAGVRLVHGVPELETRPNRYFDFDLHRYLTESARVEIAKMQREAGTDFPLTLSAAGISNAIAEAASEYGADLVVIGRGKAQKTLGRFRTHAYHIIRYSPCPVLSYSLNRQDHIFSSCIEAHPGQFAGAGQLQTGFLKP